MAWTSGAALLQWTADTLKVAVADLPALWTSNADAAVEKAYQDLLAFVGTAGYSGSQMSGSDQAVSWNLSQGLYEMAGFGKGFGDYSQEAFDRFDVISRLKEQESFTLTVDGEPIAPDGTSAVGGVAHGTNDAVAAYRRRFRRGLPNWWGDC